MTNEQLTLQFGDQVVYQFNGSLDELRELQESAGASYNYIISREVIYFVSERPVSDARAVPVTQ